MSENKSKIFSLFPSVHLVSEQLQTLFPDLKPEIITQICRSKIDDLKDKISNQETQFKTKEEISDYLIDSAKKNVEDLLSTDFKKVINGTGIVLHTGLGRAPLDTKIITQAAELLRGYINLEFELESGTRGQRLDHVDSYLQLLTGASSSAVVNNNAAAVLLSINALAAGKEVIVSRGELVEIGGSFRLPDIVGKSGARMVEIGTTNRTHLKDYIKHISDKTGAILLAHPSNYKISGFTTTPNPSEIVEIAHQYNIQAIMDLGSGALFNPKEIGLPPEKTVRDYINLDFDVVTFSGDKLIGGPQSGIIVGKTESIEKIRTNPLMRVLRCDKSILILLALTLKEYLYKSVAPDLQTYRFLSSDREQMRHSAEKIFKNLPDPIIQKFKIKIEDTQTEAGSGSLPVEEIPDVSIGFSTEKSVSRLAAAFRTASTPVIGYIRNDRFFISLKAVADDELKLLPEIISTVCQQF